MKQILIVDDNLGVAELLSNKIREMGHKVFVATSGLQAIDFFKENTPDLVILDYSLPDMDGKEVLKNLEKQDISMPRFIVSTGKGDEQIAVDMMKMGAFDYLIKDKTLVKRLPDAVKKLLHDIDREKQLQNAQKALKESEERFRNFVEKSSDFFIKLCKKSLFNYVSPNWEDHLGYSAAELINKPLYDFIIEADQPLLRKKINEALTAEHQQLTAEYRIRHKNGDVKFHTLKGYTLFEKNNLYINCIARDVTDIKTAEKKQVKAVLHAEEAERKKLAEKLHEDIGPLVASIKMYMGKIKTMKSDGTLNLSSVDFCDKLVDEAVSKVKSLANYLMPTTIYDFGLQAALRNLAQKLQEQTPKQILFDAQTPMSVQDKAYEVLLYRVSVYLLTYSLEHDLSKKIHIRLEIDDRFLTIDITVEGKGFNWITLLNSKTKHAWFYQLKSRIEALGGLLALKSTHHTKSQASISLPLATN